MPSSPTLARPVAAKKARLAAGDGAYVSAPLEPSLLDALRSPVAAFSAATGRRVHANPAFVRIEAEAEAAEPLGVIAAFERRFQGASTDAEAGCTDVLDSITGRWYELRRQALDTARGRLLIVELTDISERLLDEERRRNQHRQLLFTSKVMSVGEMAATLAHELNQPIGSLLNYLNGCLLRLARGPVATDELQGALNEARIQCERAASIITRIREFVRTREPKMTLLDLGETFSTVLSLLESELRVHQIEASSQLAPELPRVRADRVMLEQVVHNLAKNAIEAMRQQAGARRLELSARINADAMVEVVVLDTGPGVLASARDQLFSPFFTTKPDGMGIGLNICRSMVEFHGGSLYYSHPAEGGSRFCFTLPAGSDAPLSNH
jgi:signal transduction histidine kinase